MSKKLDKKLNKKKSKYITLSDASRETGYTPEHLNLLCRKGKLQGEKIGRNWFTKREWLDDFILENKTNKKGGGVRVAKVQEKIKEVVLKKENPGLLEMQEEDFKKTLGLSNRIQKNPQYAPEEKSGGRSFASSFFSLAAVAAIAIFFSTGLFDRLNENYGAPAEKIKNKVSGIFSQKENGTKNSLEIKSSDGIKIAERSSGAKVLGEEIKKITPGMDVLAQVSDSNGEDLPEGDYEVRFALYNMDRHEADPYPSSSDSSVWNETQTVHIKSGVMNTRLGISNPMPRALDPGNNEFYLGVRVGENAEMIPRKKIAVEPLALYAYSATSAQSADTAKNLNGATTGTQAGNIPLISAGGKIDISLLPTGTSGKKLVLANDPRLAGEGEVTVSGLSYIEASGMELTLSEINLISDVSGILPVINGGTGNSAIGSAGSIVYSDGTKYDFTLQGAAGQVLLSNGAGKPYWGAVGGAITPDSIDFTEIADNMTLDNNLTISASASNYSINFDSGTLFLDSANNRLGIGTTAPGQNLSIAGTLGILEGGVSPEYYTILQGGNQSQNVTYTLPTNYPADNGYILTSTTGGVFTWTPPGASTIALGGSIAGGAESGSVLFIDTNGNLAQDNDYFYYNELSHRFGVGLGNTNPQALFSVGTSSAFQINSSGNVIAGSWNASKIDISDYTNLSVGGTFLQLSGDTLSLREGTMTAGRLCTFNNSGQLECDTLSSSVGHSAVTLAGQNYLTIDGAQLITVGQINLGSTHVSGILGLSNGGTGIGTTNPGNGTLLIGNGTGYTLANLTAGTGITVTNGSGTIRIDSHNIATLNSGTHSYLTLSDQQISLGTIDISTDTNLSIGGTMLQRVDDTISLKEGTLTNGNLCTYTDANGLVCNTPSGSVGVNYWQRNGTLLSPAAIGDYIGIGTTNPTYSLDIAGTFRLSSTAPVFGSNTIVVPASGTMALGTGATNQVAYWSTANTLSGENYLSTSRGGTGIGTTAQSGQLLIGTSGGGYSLANLTAGSGVSISNASGAITIASTLGTAIDISSETNLSIGGTMLQISDDTISLKEGTLTNGRLCTYVEGTGLVCTTDPTTVGHTAVTLAGQGYLTIDGYQVITAGQIGLGTTNVTGILGLANGGTGIGTTNPANGTLLIGNGTGYSLANLTEGSGISISNTSGAITIASTLGTAIDIATETNLGVGGTVLQLVGSTLSLREGTMTTGMLCTFNASGQLECNTSSATVGHTAVTLAGQGYLTIDGSQVITAGQIGLGTTNVTGILGLSNGGTGIGTTNPGNGTLLIGNGTGYALATLTQGSGISITNASGSITLATTNITSGTGTQNYLPKWDTSGTFANSVIYETGGNVGIGTTDPQQKFSINGSLGIAGSTAPYYTILQGGAQAQNITYTLPTSYPAGNGYMLTAGTGGMMSWSSPGAAAINLGSSIGGGGTPGSVLYIDGDSELAQDNPNLFWDYNSHQLGIGTSNPDYSLDIAGTFRVSSTAPVFGSNTIVVPASGTMALGTGATNQVAYWSTVNTLSGENYLSTSRGGTGIGTTAQSGQLLIGTSGGGYSLANLTAGSGISISNASGAITINTTGITGGTGTQYYLPKWTSANGFGLSSIYNNATGVGIGTTDVTGVFQVGIGSTTPLFVSTVGYVGIGTTNPVEKLTINGNDGNGKIALRIQNDSAFATTNETWVDLAASTSGSIRTAGAIVASFTNTTEANRNGRLDFRVASNATYPTIMSVLGNGAGEGYVGIGTTNPLALFSVGSSSGFQINSSGNVIAGSWNGSRVDISDYTNLAVGGTVLQLVGSTLSLREGTMTAGNLCTFNASGQLECNTGIGSVGHDALSLTGQGYLTLDAGNQVLTAGQINIGTTQVTGILGLSNGGTGIGNTNPGNGTLLIGNGTGYTLANLTAGTGISISNASGAITINSTIESSLWTDTGSLIYPNNYTQLAITDTGRLGIGTTNPTGIFQIGIGTSVPLFVSATTGNVGIGTTSPGASLEIGTATGTWGANLRFTRSALSATIDTRFAVATDGLIIRNFDSAASNMFSFRDYNDVHIWDMTAGGRSLFNGATDNTTSTVQIGGADSLAVAGKTTILGNVGIGTTNPSKTLHINGQGYITSGLFIGSTASGNYLSIGSTGSASTVMYIGNGAIVTGTGTQNYVSYWTGTNTLGAEQYLNVSRGGTGIGTTATSGQLLIGTSGGGYTLANLTAGTGVTINNASGAITINATSSGSGSGVVNSGNAGFFSYYLTSGTAVSGQNLLFTDGSKIGIGTTNPLALFSVGSTSGFQVDASGNVTAGLYNGNTITSGTGTITLNNNTLTLNGNSTLNQDLETSDSPGFVGLTLSGMTEGSIIYAGAGGLMSQDHDNFYWNGTSHRLGIGTTSPQAMVDIFGTNNELRLSYDSDSYVSLSSDNSGNFTIATSNTTDSAFVIGNNNATNLLLILDSDATDYYIARNSSNSNLEIGRGLVAGTNPGIMMDSNGNIGIGGTAASTNPAMYFLANGYAGIGTTNPLALFSVGSASGFQINSSGNVIAGSWNGSRVDVSDYTNLSVGGTILQLSGDALSLREGTMVAGKICIFNSSGQLECNTDSASVGHSAVTLAGQGYLTIDGSQVITAGQIGLGTTNVTGILGLANGGTGIGTTATSGQLLIGTSGGGYTLANLTAGTGVTISNASGSITINAISTGSGSGVVNSGNAGFFSYYLASGTAVSGQDLLFTDGSKIGIGTSSPTGIFQIGIGATTPLFVSATTGYVGIGTTDPTSKLYVKGNAIFDYSSAINATAATIIVNSNSTAVDAESALMISNTNSTANTINSLNFRHANASSSLVNAAAIQASLSGITAGTENGFLRFATMKSGTLTEQMRISSDGYVGIGTTNPLALFSVGSTSGFQVDASGNVTAGLYNGNTITSGTGTITLNNNTLTLNGNSTLNQDLETSDSPGFVGLTLSGMTEGSIIYAGAGGLMSQDHDNFYWNGTSHRLGIGTTSPQAMVDIFGTNNELRLSYDSDSYVSLSSNANGELVMSGSSADGSSMILGTGNAEDTSLIFDGSAQDYYFGLDDTNDSLNIGLGQTVGVNSFVTIISSGYVGIGTTNPLYGLDINGTFRLSSTAPVFGSNTITIPASGTMALGTGSANAVAYWSDANTLAGENYLSLSRGGTGIGTTSQSGQLLIGNSSGGYTLSTLTAGTGIGITSASGSITISANGTFMPTGSYDGQTLRYNGSSWLANDLIFNNGTSIGIGFTAPGSKLTLSGGLSIGTTSPTSAYLTKAAPDGGAIFEGKLGIGTTSPLGLFQIGVGTSVPMFVSTAGRVGIGTTSPSQIFQINNSGTSAVVVTSSGYMGIGTTAPASMLNIFGTSNALRLSYNTTNYATLSANSNGELVIGGSSSSGPSIVMGSGLAENIYLLFDGNYSAVEEFSYLGFNSANNSIQAGLGQDVGTNAYITLLLSSGYVGIGTTNPLYGLDISGTFRLSSTAPVFGSNTITVPASGTMALGTGAANQVAYWSDANTLAGENYLSLSRGGTGIGTTNPGNGTLLIGNGTGYSLANLTAGTGVNISNGSGTITINATGGTSMWSDGGSYIYPNNYTQLAITDTGYLGIGTTSPLGLFQIGVGTSVPMFVSTAGRVGIGTTSPSQIFQINNSGTSAVVVNSSGYLGLGGTSPLALLDVNGVGAHGLGTAAAPSFAIRTDLDTGMWSAGADTVNFSTGGTERIRINSSGYVGIGSTNPTTLFTVGAGNNFQVDANGNILAGNYQGTTIAVAYGGTGTNTQFDEGAVVFAGGSGIYNQDRANFYYNSTNHFLGLGTTSPGAILDLFGTGTLLRLSYDSDSYTTLASSNSGSLIISGSDTSQSGIKIGSGLEEDTFISFDGNAQDYYLALDDTNDTLNIGLGQTVGVSSFLTIESSGYVGIGTTNPSYALDVIVSGTGPIARFANASDNSSCAFGAGGILTCTSDARLKKNISDSDYGLDEIVKLRPVDFNWKSQPDSTQKTIGFIAQEVAGVMPQLVITDANGYKELNTIGLVPVIVKGMQEQQEEISNLQFSISNQFSIFNESIDQLNDNNLSVNDKMNILGDVLASESEIMQQIQQDSQTLKTTTETHESRIKTLEDQIALIKEANQAVIDFAKVFDPEAMIYKDAMGNIDLGTGKLEADGVVAGAFAVKVTDVEKKTIGSAEILPVAKDDDGNGNDDWSRNEVPMADPEVMARDGKSVMVKTKAASDTAKIFVTAKTLADKPLSVTQVIAGTGFKVEVKDALSDKIVFDWWIVEEK